ncbi:hypothetical protein JJJ17_02815 [Paracoccus caeni]|uniref:Uncharacterized protein n=1 Tax=Paracoccus caeni TaxID=657651 RepID=A0A934S9W7_9RHOB|nr:hypothetical protein [Paracoccus caeni]MBK4214851.1 hypothetical protein [Paracoccus caeni]
MQDHQQRDPDEDEPQDDGPVMSREEADRLLAQHREKPATILLTWIVRVLIVGLVLLVLNHFFGPLEWMWLGLALYALVSLFSSFALARLKRRQYEQLAKIATGQRD